MHAVAAAPPSPDVHDTAPGTPGSRLLATKYLPPPLRPGAMTRRSSLARAPEQRVTLVSAPPGFGKTTLVRSWFDDERDPVAWLTLDEGDNDPVVFAGYLLAAVKRAIPGGARRIGMAASAVPDEIVTGVLNTLTTTSVRLVLDDYHVIESGTVHALVTRLVRHLREPAGLVVLTRQDPPLPLARLRSRGELAELRAADLRFTADEGAAFLRQAVGPRPDDATLALVVERAEGWPAALQLAAMTLRSAPDPTSAAVAFRGTDRYLFDYLTEEVLAQQPPHVRRFLALTSVADWLTGDLCDALTGERGGRAVLEGLEAANLLVARLDAEGDAWRYHALLAEMLRADLSPELRDSLDRRAGEWFAAHGMPAAAIRHFLRAGDHLRARAEIIAAAEPALAHGEFVTFLGWCEALPADVVAGSVDLGILRAWARFMRGDFRGAAASLVALDAGADESPRLAGRRRCLEAWFANRSDSPDAERLAREAVDATRGDSPMFRSLAHTILGEALIGTDVGAARPAFEEAHRLADGSGPSALRFGTVYSLALTLLAEGRRGAAERLCRDTIDASVAAREHAPAIGMVHLLLGVARYEAADLDAARQHIATGWDLLERGNLRALLLGAAEWQEALALHALGHREQAWQRVEAARRDGRRHEVPRIDLAMDALSAELLLREGDPAGAERRIGRASAAGTRPIGATPDRVRLTRARVQLGSGAWRAAVATAEPLLASQRAGGRHGRAAETLLVLAAAYERGGASPQAREAFEEALDACAAEERRMVFLDPVLPMSARLRRSRHVAPAFVDDLLGRMAGQTRLVAPGAPDARSGREDTAPYVEPLSARELEVLRLVAAGRSNEEIGLELFITTGTAKWHVHNLLGKSGARDRVGLAAWAHARALV